MKQCLIKWNGKEADGGGNFTLQPGTVPSAAVLRFRLEYTHTRLGVLTLQDGVQSPRHFRNCWVSRDVVTEGDGGPRWRELTILDRRWQWGENYHAIYGEYNRKPVIATDPVNPKSYRELAAICLQALGENRFDVSALPHYKRVPVKGSSSRFKLQPIGMSVDWDGENPADALREILEATGTEVVLGTDDIVRVVQLGVSFRNPKGDHRLMDFQQAREVIPTPKALVFEGGNTAIQHDLPLEAVGKEVTGALAGEFVPISQLSYKPTNGWEFERPGDFGGAGPGLGDAEKKRAIALARKHVFKTYRVGGWLKTDQNDENRNIILPQPPRSVSNRSSGGRLSASQQKAVSNYFTLRDGEEWRVLPLYDAQLEGFVSEKEDAVNVHEVLGYYFNSQNKAGRNNPHGGTAINSHADIASNNPNAFSPGFSRPIEAVPTPPNSTLKVPWDYTLDVETGVVEFSEYTYFRDRSDNNKAYPAVIRLRTSFRLRDPQTASHLSQQYWATPSSSEAVGVVKVLKKSDTVFEYGLRGSLNTARVISNERLFTEEALAAIEKEIRSFRVTEGLSLPFKGFVYDYQPDGLIKALVFDVSEQGGGTSHVDFGVERASVYTTLDELRKRRVVSYNAWLQQQIRLKRAAGVLKK